MEPRWPLEVGNRQKLVSEPKNWFSRLKLSQRVKGHLSSRKIKGRVDFLI